MIFDVKVDTSNIEKAKKLMASKAQKAMDRAKLRAYKSGASAIASTAKGGAPMMYTIKSGDMKAATKVNKDFIEVTSRLYTIGASPSHFIISPKAYRSQKGIKVAKRKKMSATIKKGQKKKMPHVFIANPAAINGGHAMLWERNGSKINPMHSLSAAQMVSNPEVYENVMKAVNETYEKRLEHELERMGL